MYHWHAVSLLSGGGCHSWGHALPGQATRKCCITRDGADEADRAWATLTSTLTSLEEPDFTQVRPEPARAWLKGLCSFHGLQAASPTNCLRLVLSLSLRSPAPTEHLPLPPAGLLPDSRTSLLWEFYTSGAIHLGWARRSQEARPQSASRLPVIAFLHPHATVQSSLAGRDEEWQRNVGHRSVAPRRAPVLLPSGQGPRPRAGQMDGARAHNAHVVISIFCLKDTAPSVIPQPGFLRKRWSESPKSVGRQGRGALSICPERCHRDRLDTQRCLQGGRRGRLGCRSWG